MKKEPLKFDANMIGSEIFDRFSSDIYTPRSIVRELVKNAHDSYYELDHFVDSGACRVTPATHERNVLVQVNQEERVLLIQDNGLGLDRNGIGRLISIALTDKRDIEGVTGFRGIGFWSAYTAGDSIVVESTKVGTDKLFRLTLNTERMRELQSPSTSIEELNQRDCIKLESGDASRDAHYTKIMITAAKDNDRLFDLLRDSKQVEAILREGCACEFAPATNETEALQKQVDSFYSRNGLQTIPVMVSNDRHVYKTLPTNLRNFVTRNIEVPIKGKGKGKAKTEIVARIWYAENGDNGVVESDMAGFRLMRRGFPVGGRNLCSEHKLLGSEVEVARADLLNWYVGEIHVVSDHLRPDAAGEQLRDTPVFYAFREELRRFYVELIKDVFLRSKRANLVRSYMEYLRFLEELTARKPRRLELLDKLEVAKIKSTVDQHAEQSRARGKDEAKPKSEVHRDSQVKKLRQKVQPLVNKIVKKYKVKVDELVRPKKPGRSKTKQTAKATPQGTAGSTRGYSREDVLALIEELRDSINTALRNDPEAAEQTSKAIDAFVERALK